MDTSTILANVESFIRERDYVSFPEVARHLETLNVETHGDLSAELVPNLLLWTGMSAEFCAILDELLAQDRVNLEPSSLLVYFVDGAVLSLPIAKRPPRKGYARPHWLPVVLRSPAKV